MGGQKTHCPPNGPTSHRRGIYAECSVCVPEFFLVVEQNASPRPIFGECARCSIMHSSHFRRLYFPLVLSGLLVSACSTAAPPETKSAAAEKTTSEVRTATAPARAESTPISPP